MIIVNVHKLDGRFVAGGMMSPETVAEKIQADKEDRILLEDMFASVARTGFPWKECISRHMVRVERAL